MMPLRPLFAVCCLLSATCAAAGDEIESAVIEQIDRLDSPSRAERLAAEQRIRELGPAALPYLPESDEIEAVQVRETVDRLRIELEQIVIEQLLQPTMVDLTGIVTVGEWAESVEQQTGYSVELSDESLADIPLAEDTLAATGSTTFWQAVTLLEDQGAISVGRSDGGGFVLSRGEADADPWRHDSTGAIRVSAGPLREIDNLIDPGINARLRTQLRLDVEPKLAGLFLHWTPAELHASIAGIDLSPVGAVGRRELPIAALQRIEFPVDFTAPWEMWSERSDDAGDLSLDGSVEVTVAADFTAFEFRHLDEPGEIVRRRGGVVATLESFESSRNQDGAAVWQATLVVDYQSRTLELDSYQLWVFSNAVSLHREDGMVLLPAMDRQVSPAQGGAIRMSFLFDDPLDDLATATLVYEAPTAIIELPVEFEIEGAEAGGE